MAQAKHEFIRIPSGMTCDAIVRAAFQRAESDYGQTFAIPNDLVNDFDFRDVRASDKPSSRKCHRGTPS